MQGENIQQHARDRVVDLPGAELEVENLPRGIRPVDPDTFGNRRGL